MRLPLAIISLIEAHLPPPRPSCVSPISGFAQHGAVAKTLVPKLGVAGPSDYYVPKRNRSDSKTPIPGPTFGPLLNRRERSELRNAVHGRAAGKEHGDGHGKWLAHNILNRYPVASPTTLNSGRAAEPGLTRARASARYSQIINILSNRPDSASLSTLRSLISRSITERVPLTLDSLSKILSAHLAHGESTLPLIQKILPLLPDADGLGDIQFLAVLVRAIIKDIQPPPAEVEALLGDCFALSLRVDLESAKESKGRGEEWPMEFHALVVESVAGQGDFKGVLRAFTKFKSSLDQQPIATTTTTNTSTTTDATDAASTKLALEDYESARRATILQTYLCVLGLWTKTPSARISRNGSHFPRLLTRDLTSRLGLVSLSETGAATGVKGGAVQQVPLIWLNAWMNAERIAGNAQATKLIWEWIVAQGQSQVKDARAPAPILREEEFLTRLKALKLLPREEVRSAISSWLNHNHSIGPGGADRVKANRTTPLLDAAIGSSLHHTDYPLALFLARLFGTPPSCSPDPSLKGNKTNKVNMQEAPQPVASARTIDILAGGLIRAWRRGGLNTLFHRQRQRRSSAGAGLGVGAAILPKEWDMISRALERELQYPEGEIQLPLGSPQGRLEAPSTQATAEGDHRRIHVQNPVKIVKLWPGLLGLLEKVNVELVMDSRDRQERGLSREEVLEVIMAEVQEEMAPPESRIEAGSS